MMLRVLPVLLLAASAFAQTTSPGWRHLSVKNGDISVPMPGKQQTGNAVFDIDGDGTNDFVITERTATPGVVWFQRSKDGWKRYVLDPEMVRIEAGATFADVDGDGDLDFLAGGEGRSNEVWWWENPKPNFDAPRWTRRAIKASGGRKHHDLMWGDFDGDGKPDLVFWNQGDQKLFLAHPPSNPRTEGEWPRIEVYAYSKDSEPEQRFTPPGFKSVNEHEGLSAADIDGDGKVDIVGGGMWFKHQGGDKFLANPVDPGYTFSRAAAAQLIEGGRPEILLVVGDGVGPMMLYEWVKGRWTARRILDAVDNGHSLSLVDFNGDGHIDIFCAEMRLSGGNPDSKTWLLFGDGKGGFKETVVATGFDNHESKIADLDGDGDLDIFGKPYNYETPNLNIWLNTGAK
ncbi:MAG TPA: VCBS repeat-containing protein [Bryobacteraceae bacterium]|nr:VCBS repeat-containing protein [Bryobacteraceae bacterium]